MRTLTGFTIILSILALISFGFIAPAGKADEILEASKIKLQKLQDFGSNFIYEISGPGISGTIAKSGSLKFQQGKYFIDLGDEAFYCDQEAVWIHHKEDKEVSVMEYDPEEFMNIEALFELYEASSESRYDGVETIDGQKCHKIFLAIKDGSLDYNQAYLWINQKTNFPAKATLLNRKQTQTTFELQNFQPNPGYGNSVFRFDINKHPGVTVYDER